MLLPAYLNLLEFTNALYPHFLLLVGNGHASVNLHDDFYPHTNRASLIWVKTLQIFLEVFSGMDLSCPHNSCGCLSSGPTCWPTSTALLMPGTSSCPSYLRADRCCRMPPRLRLSGSRRCAGSAQRTCSVSLFHLWLMGSRAALPVLGGSWGPFYFLWGELPSSTAFCIALSLPRRRMKPSSREGTQDSGLPSSFPRLLTHWNMFSPSEKTPSHLNGEKLACRHVYIRVCV